MWSPPPYVTGHNGEPLSPECDFFVVPPAEIGPVRTAYTSLKKGGATPPVAIRAALALAVGIVESFFWEVALVPLWVYLGSRKSRFKHFCPFVGDSGCARYQCEQERSNFVQVSSFRFADADAVSLHTLRRTKSGGYNGTNFYFHWYSDSGTPPPDNFLNFASAVKSAWYRYAAPKIDAEFTQKGAVKFYLGSRYSCVMTLGVIDFEDGHGKLSRCGADEIASAKLFDGQLTIRRKDARRGLFDLFNSEGVYTFPYGAIHNARLFIYLFERSLAVKV